MFFSIHPDSHLLKIHPLTVILTPATMWSWINPLSGVPSLGTKYWKFVLANQIKSQTGLYSSRLKNMLLFCSYTAIISQPIQHTDHITSGRWSLRCSYCSIAIWALRKLSPHKRSWAMHSIDTNDQGKLIDWCDYDLVFIVTLFIVLIVCRTCTIILYFHIILWELVQPDIKFLLGLKYCTNFYALCFNLDLALTKPDFLKNKRPRGLNADVFLSLQWSFVCARRVRPKRKRKP